MSIAIPKYINRYFDKNPNPANKPTSNQSTILLSLSTKEPSGDLLRQVVAPC